MTLMCHPIPLCCRWIKIPQLNEEPPYEIHTGVLRLAQD